MKVLFDISPISNDQHKVRGVGTYIDNLKNQFEKKKDLNVSYVNGYDSSDNGDILHVPYFDPFQITLPKKTDKKVVVTIHDLIPLKFPSHFPAGVKGKVRWHLQRFLLKKVHAVITDSEASKEDIMRLAGVPEKKIHVVYLAAEKNFKKTDEGKISIKDKFKLPDSFALYVGDITWNKNVPNLILASKKENIPLVLVGKAITIKHFDRTNPWNKDLSKAQELLKENKNCITPGYIAEEELVAFYNQATLFVLPSRYEGFGLPILEAMQCGTPVLTTRNGSIPEVAKDAALYITRDDSDNIAIGLKKLFTDTKLQKEMSEKGQKNAEKFSWEKTSDQTIKVYEQIYSK